MLDSACKTAYAFLADFSPSFSDPEIFSGTVTFFLQCPADHLY
jgi:hypothetical protein